MNSLLKTIADEIIAVYPASQFEAGSDDRFGKVVGPTGSFVLSQAADNFYVSRVGGGRQMTAHQYKPESEHRVAHSRDSSGASSSPRSR